MLKKITVIAFALTLTACANTKESDEKIASLTNKVETLSAQVADLEAKQQDSQAATEQATKDVQATNERIDNIVASYKK